MVIIAAKWKIFLEPWKFSEIRDVHDEMHLIHSCYGAGWEKY